MRIFKNIPFERFARKENINDASLCKAIHDVMQGKIDADLGGGVIKQRIARSGQGKSGSFRSIILFRIKTHAFFVYGFSKSERENIKPDELKALKELAEKMLGYSEIELVTAIKNNVLIEVVCET